MRRQPLRSLVDFIRIRARFTTPVRQQQIKALIGQLDASALPVATIYDALILSSGAPPPNPTGIVPTFGVTTGGTPVTISGTAFTGATSADIGGSALAAFLVVNDTTITGTTTAHGAGIQNVHVVGPGGTGTLVNGFTYFTVPAVTSISIDFGPAIGGTNVTITGSGFSLGSATSADIGGTALSAFLVVNDTTITGTTAAHVAQADLTVTVTGPVGSGFILNAFAYLPPTSLILLSDAAFVTLNGTDVASIADQSGLVHDFAEIVPANQPAYTLAGPINGKPALTMDLAKAMDGPEISLIISPAAHEMIHVVYPTSFVGANPLDPGPDDLIMGDAALWFAMAALSNAGTPTVGVFSFGIAPPAVAYDVRLETLGVAPNTAMMVGSRHTAGSLYIRTNSNPESPGLVIPNVGFPGAGDITRWGVNGASSFRGQWSASVAYDGSWTVPERAAVDGWLKRRYALP